MTKHYLLAFLITALVAGFATAQQESLIRVGPNVPVSVDGEGNSWEVMIAANPANPKNLLGGGMVWTSGVEARVYYSKDGGYTWQTVTFPELSNAGVDPQVAFGRTGTAYFVAIANHPDLGVLYFYRSTDGGETWNKPAVLGTTDHPQITVDHTTGRFSGQIYVSVNSSGIQIFRSRNDGRSWIGPIDVAGAARSGFERITRNPLIFSDGELFVPFVEFPTQGVESGTHPAPPNDRVVFLFCTSNDGGATFTAPEPLRTDRGEVISGTRVSDNFQRHVGSIGSPFFSVDSSAGPFRDRLYAVWADEIYRPRAIGGGKQAAQATRLLFSYSTNRGQSWSNPQVVSPGSPGVGSQFGESIAVNKEGIVGITWYDTRDTPRSARAPYVQRYFAASIDGGSSFLPARPISSVATDLERVSANSVSGALGSGTTFALRHEGFTDHSGGHYVLGLTANTEGIFHGFWPDGRTGSYQLWATRIRVDRPESAADGALLSLAGKLVQVDVTEKVELTFEPLRRLAPVGTVELPVRLKNNSDQPLYRPIIVEVTQLNPKGTLLNGGNRGSGAEAKFDYSQALGDFDLLPPGATSEGIVWRFKAPVLLTGLDPRAFEPARYTPELPRVRVKVTARMARPN